MKYFRKITSFIRSLVTKFKKTGRRTKLITLAVVTFALIGILVSLLVPQKDASTDTKDATPVVTLKSAREIATTLDPLPLVGTVRSATEATILTEASGRIVGVYRSLGQYVSSGSIIGEIENSSERAQVLQAEANLARVLISSEDAQLGSAAAGLQSAKESSLTTLLTAYAAVQNAVLQQADQTFSNPTTGSAKYLLLTNDSALANKVTAQRITIQRTLSREQNSGAVLSVQSDLDSELATAITELKDVRAYLDLVVESLNKAVPNSNYSASDISGFAASVTAGRTAVTASITALAGSIENLAAKRAANEVAENNLQNSTTGVKRQDVLSAEASLAAARATLEKKIIRAPFPGTLNALNIELGQFVGAFEPAATVANNGLLEIRAYVTEQDKKYVIPGLAVRSKDGITGAITSVAPALDPITKRIEVRIALTGSEDITNGQSVRLLIERVNKNAVVTTPKVPLTAISFIGNDPNVFTVDQEGIIIALPVTLGVILGDQVEVEGIDLDTKVIVDARGFLVGDKVTVE
jgi:multidrug efflux pump subunit AcrA (membrane-fusion protein)